MSGVKPGVRAYLKQCRAEGRRMAVVTSSVPATAAPPWSTGLARYFEDVFSPTIWVWKSGTRPSGARRRKIAAWSRNGAPSLTTASPPRGARPPDAGGGCVRRLLRPG